MDPILDFNTVRIFNRVVDQRLCSLTFSETFGLYSLPLSETQLHSWAEIKTDTFESDMFIKSIAKISSRSESYVKTYFQNPQFQLECLTGLFAKKNPTKAEFYAKVMMGLEVSIVSSEQSENKLDENAITLAIVNGFPIFWKLAKNHINIAARHNPKLYFEIASFGNISIKTLEAAVDGQHIDIIKSLLETYVPNEKILERALHEGNHEICKLLIDTSRCPKNAHLLNYPLLNSDWDLFEYMINCGWQPDVKCVYSAILSGDIEILKKVTAKFGENLHANKTLDAVEYSGPKILLARDILYTTSDGNKYAAHCMNYAVQSKSLSMVQYVYGLGYGISLSNLTTAILQAGAEILEFLCQQLKFKPLPFYFWYYLSHKTYVLDKITKAKILIDNNMLTFDKITGSVEDYRIANVHLKILENRQHVVDLLKLDDKDFYLWPMVAFSEKLNVKIDILMVTQIKFGLWLGSIDKIRNLILACIDAKKKKSNTKQLILNTVCYYGTKNQIAELDIKNLLGETCVITDDCAQEILAENSITKIVYLVKNMFLIKTPKIQNFLENLSDELSVKLFA
jgi:hypothetical protein